MNVVDNNWRREERCDEEDWIYVKILNSLSYVLEKFVTTVCRNVLLQ